MTERPILMSAPMVRACLREVDPKTQTRRVVFPQPRWLPEVKRTTFGPGPLVWPLGSFGQQCGAPIHKMKYGVPGDRLWVRETFAGERAHGFIYRADGKHEGEDSLGWRWRPAIHMPRAACRLVLDVTAVRVERLQDISEADCVAEGVPKEALYRALWNDLNAERGFGWATNPWVWVISFRRADALEAAA